MHICMYVCMYCQVEGKDGNAAADVLKVTSASRGPLIAECVYYMFIYIYIYIYIYICMSIIMITIIVIIIIIIMTNM